MNPFFRLIIFSVAPLLFLAACDNAVRANKSVTYIINGNPKSALYPLAVQRESEDVRIQLKKDSPIPAVFSVDSAGSAVAFNYTIDKDTLIVPGKFRHLQLRSQGVESVDVICNTN